MKMSTEINEFIKEVFESKRKKKEFWGKVIIALPITRPNLKQWLSF